MDLNHRLARVTEYHIALFLLPLFSLLYYAWWKAPELAQQPRNPMHVAPIDERGSLTDRDGFVMAVSDQKKRRHPLGRAAGPLIGYLIEDRYQGGLESMLEFRLSPEPPPKSLWGAILADQNHLLGRLHRGPTIRLTLDHTLQKRLYNLLAAKVGALVVMSAVTGEVLASVSCPSFDPEHVDRNWAGLHNDPSSPLIERVGSGLYPVLAAGGRPLLSLQEAEGHPWFRSDPFPSYPGASAGVRLEDRLLYSPLMLCQIACQTSKDKRPIVPHLLFPSTKGGALSLWPQGTKVPYLKSDTKRGSWRITSLAGPAFRESTAFSVTLGYHEGREALAWALVLESHRELPPHLLQELLATLTLWASPG